MFGSNEEFEQLRFILNSKMRSKILICLFYSQDNLEVLRKILNKPSPTILHVLHELSVLGLTKKIGKSYVLTTKGNIFVVVLNKFVLNFYFVKNNYKFLSEHSINSLPDFSLKEFYKLNSGDFVCSIDSDLSKPLEKFVKTVDGTNNLKILLPIFSKVHLDSILKNFEDKESGNLVLITNNNILKFMKKEGYVSKFYNLSKKCNVSILRYDGDLDLFLSCGDKFTLTSLFFIDGHFDDSMIFADSSDESIEWTNKILETYIEDSIKIL